MLEIAGRFPGLNDIVKAAKKHWAAYAKEKKALTRFVEILFRAHGCKPVGKPCIVRFTWVEPDRRRDLDNITAGQKFCFDGMVAAGVLPNDGWKWVHGIEHRFAVDKDNPRVIVEVMDAEYQEDSGTA